MKPRKLSIFLGLLALACLVSTPASSTIINLTASLDCAQANAGAGTCGPTFIIFLLLFSGGLYAESVSEKEILKATLTTDGRAIIKCMKIIEALSSYKDKIFLVRYEDLIANKRVFFDLCNFVDIDGDYIFEKDSNKGVNNLHEEVIHELKRGTSKIINLLDSNRTYKITQKSLICRITNLSPFN